MGSRQKRRKTDETRIDLCGGDWWCCRGGSGGGGGFRAARGAKRIFAGGFRCDYLHKAENDECRRNAWSNDICR